jgi:hypothetical protein
MHSGAANSVRSLSPRASKPVPQTLARVGEGWGEGPFFGRIPRPLTPPRERRAATPSRKGRGWRSVRLARNYSDLTGTRF